MPRSLTSLLRLGCGIALVASAPRADAQTSGSVFPGVYGEELVEALAATYAPASTLPLAQAEDSLLVSWSAGMYSGLPVPAGCPTPCDPSDWAYDAASLVADPIWPRAFGTDAGTALGDLHNLAPAREAIRDARAGLPFGESADAETATWFAGDTARADAPPVEDRDAWTEVGGSFEPRESVKGDVARALFYVYAVYGPSGSGQVAPAFFEPVRETLLMWAEADPPSYVERSWNDRVAALQSTASGDPQPNPFVLDPSLARRAFFAGPVLYVRPPDPAGEPRVTSGTSWATAFDDLSAALSAAAVVGVVEEVWVAAGTYTPGDNRYDTFGLRSGLALYGGFVGTEVDRDQRDPSSAVTVLSGDIGAPGDMTDNVDVVVTAVGTEAAPLEALVLDGFTVTGGGTPGTTRRGAGGMTVEYASIEIVGCTFAANHGHTAGALWARDSHTILADSRFVDNAGTYVGGLYVSDGTLVMRDVAFEANTSTNVSGGAQLFSTRARLENLTFEGNTSGSERLDGRGGGLSLEYSDVTLARSSFRFNRTLGPGGGLYIDRGTVDVSDVVFYGNRAGVGQGRYDDVGGGLSASPADSLVLTNAVFVANAAGYGSAMSIEARDALLSNIAVVANGAHVENGGAIQVGRLRDGDELTLANSVVWGNGEAERFGPGFTFLEGTSNVPFSFNGNYTYASGYRFSLPANVVPYGCEPFPFALSVQCGDLVDGEPVFARPPSPGPDGIWATADDDFGDLRPTSESVAIDAGDAAFLPADAWDLDGDGDEAELLPLDLAGEPRLVGDGVDLGPYEGAVSVAEEPGLIAEREDGLTVAPNPFRTRAEVVLRSSRSEDVTVAVYDVLGRKVASIHDGLLAPGEHRILLDASALPSGTYVVRAELSDQILVALVTVAR